MSTTAPPRPLLQPTTTGGVAPQPIAPADAPAPSPTPPRLVSLDAYRGFIMLLMASGAFAFATINRNMEQLRVVAGALGLSAAPGGPINAVPGLAVNRAELKPVSRGWTALAYQFDHAPWVGCAFWDLIQPSFMFMVGVALPYSFASRKARGESYPKMLAHAAWRALVLVLLAVFLSSPFRLPGASPPYNGPSTNWIFPNVLAQIGLGYVFVFLLVGRGLKAQFVALAAILVGYTLFFGLWPLPGTDYNYRAVGVPDDFPRLTGWFAHWNKNANAAHFFDVWFLNLFPRQAPFKFNEGGYQTLNFVPSMATMILGLMAGEMLRGRRSAAGKLYVLLAAGAACLAVGWVMGLFVTPIVKRIWTPSWAVYSAGWTFLLLALFYAAIDVVGWKRWAFPFVVVGMNSIAMYLMAQLMTGWVKTTLQVHLGKGPFTGPLGPALLCAAALVVLWLFCLWLYRRKVFLRI
jgi:heparan-alpha-glucosaminide N-acetyltransferase